MVLHAGVYGYAGADGRPFAAASVKHGIVVGEASLVTLPTHRHSEDGRPHPAADHKVCPCLTWSLYPFWSFPLGKQIAVSQSCMFIAHCSHD